MVLRVKKEVSGLMSLFDVSKSMNQVFIKLFPKLAESDVQALFDHALEVESALVGEKEIVIPHAVARKGRAIHYVYLPLEHPMLACVQSFSCTSEQMEKIGSFLRRLHDVKRVVDGASLLHSDYVPHNFFLEEDKFVLIDPHPPENLPFTLKRLYGPPLDEVIGFLFCLLSDAGFRRSLSCLGYTIALTRAFLTGYGQRGIRFFHLIAPILRCLQDTYRLKRVAGFSILHAVVHCVAGGVMTLYVIGRGL